MELHYLVNTYFIFHSQGNLASVYSLEEEQFVVAKIRESHEYTTSTVYWLGGKFNIYNEWKWVDNTSIMFNGKWKEKYYYGVIRFIFFSWII